mgnify:CR=1 FL=1
MGDRLINAKVSFWIFFDKVTKHKEKCAELEKGLNKKEKRLTIKLLKFTPCVDLFKECFFSRCFVKVGVVLTNVKKGK